MTSIRDMAEYCPVDSTIREVCPNCNGGSTGERCLAISRYASGYAWFCHRATCGYRGTEWDAGLAHGRVKSHTPVQFDPKAAYPRRLTDREGIPEFSVLDDEVVARSYVYGKKYPELDQTDVMFVCHDVWGVPTAYHVRRKLISGRKFCKTYATGAGCIYAFYPSEFSFTVRNVWLVEDPISAMRITQLGRGKDVGCALLGTNVNKDVVKDINNRLGGPTFILALDRDASIKGLHAASRIQQETGALVFPVPLSRDIKNMNVDDVEALLDVYAK